MPSGIPISKTGGQLTIQLSILSAVCYFSVTFKQYLNMFLLLRLDLNVFLYLRLGVYIYLFIFTSYFVLSFLF